MGYVRKITSSTAGATTKKKKKKSWEQRPSTWIAFGSSIAVMLIVGLIYDSVDSSRRAKETAALRAELLADAIAEGTTDEFYGIERMPDVKCMILQDAQDLIQEKTSIYRSDSYEVGGDRKQINDRNWLVVQQTPAAGTEVNENTRPRLGVVSWLNGMYC